MTRKLKTICDSAFFHGWHWLYFLTWRVPKVFQSLSEVNCLFVVLVFAFILWYLDTCSLFGSNFEMFTEAHLWIKGRFSIPIFMFVCLLVCVFQFTHGSVLYIVSSHPVLSCPYNPQKLGLSTELMRWIDHSKEIQKLTFRALALRRNSGFYVALFTQPLVFSGVVNLHSRPQRSPSVALAKRIAALGTGMANLTLGLASPLGKGAR